MHRPTLIAAVLALCLLPLACGEKDEPSSTDPVATTTTETDEVPAPTETVDDPAELPKGWTEQVNAEAGFTIGVPPGWEAEPTAGGQGSIFRSPDGLIVMTVTADRTQGALQLPLDEFATRTAETFGSEVVGRQQFKDLKITRPAPFEDVYEAEAVRAIGRSKKTGTLERLFVVVVRREDQAAYVFVSRENAEQQPTADRDDVKAIIRSLRGRPPA